MDDVQGTQNEEQNLTDDQSQSGEESGQTQDQTNESSDKEVKKERDFEKGMYKFRDLYKQTKAELDQTRSQTPANNQQVNGQPDAQQTEALRLLRETMEKVVEPLKSELGSLKEEKVWDNFEKQPFVKELGPEINAELKSIEKDFGSLPLDKKLELARNQAIAKNLDTIVKVSKETGMNQAYGNQQIKGQKGLGESGATNKGDTGIKSLWDKMNSDALTNAEYLENKEQLDAYERELMGL